MSATCEVVAKEYLLTPRELEVLKPLVQGDDAQDIAGRLYISPNTVKSHIQNIYNKLGVHSRKELLRVVESRLKLLESR
ncbi:response regulator transcription factor [Eggerthella sinensis]|uniref:response regulator transcription factor n=1 Tax=Eggerthella sinensis TaxID=242230 RepID=UPI0022E69879|nr:helix-turn-helix transcriptional regulator [Eggerthella sinensis]